jgi:hypothetical protein
MGLFNDTVSSTDYAAHNIKKKLQDYYRGTGGDMA